MSARGDKIRALWQDPAWRAATIAARNSAGRDWSEDSRRKASVSHTGRPLSERHRRAISDSLSSCVTPELVERARSMGRANKGRRPSLLTRYRLSAARVGRPSPKKGHSLSEETKRLIGDKVRSAHRTTNLLGLRAKRRRR